MKYLFFLLSFSLIFVACKTEEPPMEKPPEEVKWSRYSENPIFRDVIPNGSYQVASDPHVFFDEQGELRMIYSGDVDGNSSIKLVKGTDWYNWGTGSALISEVGPSGLDISKETSFYRLSSTGKHQVYYIGYSDETTYEAQVYLAESSSLEGPYTQLETPVVSRGTIAGKEVHCITSPSVVEHEGSLYMTFIGWDASPNNVTEVWILGAISNDEGHTWTDFREVETRIGMEGQVTKAPDGSFYSVRTNEHEDKEAIFFSKADHPFGPWTEEKDPILIQAGAPLEVDEIIAPQLTFDPVSNEKYLYYTGANYQTGWWVMLAIFEE